jgi:signal transduction histidine kinase
MDIVHPEDRQRAERAYVEGIESGRGFSMELRLRRVDGVYRWFLGRARPLRDDQDKLIKFLGTATDIEDMKRAEAIMSEQALVLETTVAERTSELLEKVGELEALSFGVAHDMRAPLRIMRGFAELLLTDHAAGLDATGLTYLKKIGTAARRMDALVDDVLTYTRIMREEVQLRPVDLEATLREIIESYPQLQVNQAEVTLVGPLPSVLGNEASLTQCFSNLLSNAVKFVAPGTVARVKVSAEDRDTHVRVWIEDNGVGIAEKDRERIFTLFERLAPATYGGTGVGLAVVRKAVARLKGRVGVESSPGQGSRFWIELLKAPLL